MPIAYFGGPEGAGKTALMTKFARQHHTMGGEVWAFPGYELKNDRGRVVSKLVNPAELPSLINEMQYILLLIDEIQNFFNHHKWYNNLVDLMSYGAAAQRRKREFAILATGPIFEWLPLDLRLMFHVVFNCRDSHWRDRTVDRGYKIAFSITDRRGVLSGYPGFTTEEKVFYPGSIFKYYDTFALVDPKYQNMRVKIKSDVVNVDSEGRMLDTDMTVNSKALDKFVSEYQADRPNPLMEQLKQILAKFEKKGMKEFDSELLYDICGAQGQGIKIKLGKLLPQLGWDYCRWNKKYIKTDCLNV